MNDVTHDVTGLTSELARVWIFACCNVSSDANKARSAKAKATKLKTKVQQLG